MSRDRASFAAAVAAGFALLTAPRLLLHELWRDEAWLWLVATGSGTLSDLLEPLARSGQGNLFPLLCWAASRFTSSPRALQALHLVLATAAAWAFARWAPLRRTETALFVFGYFPFYEYAVLSRHYVLGLLLAWAALAAGRARRPAIALGAAIGLLCQTTVYGLLLAFSLGIGWALERRFRQPRAEALPRGEAVTGAVLALAGAVAGVAQLVPRPGTTFAPGWRLEWDAAHAAATLAAPWRAFVPLPAPELRFWNTNLLDAWPGLLAAAGACVLVLAAALLGRSRAALLAFALGGLGLAAFGYVKYLGVVRHHGHWWLLFAGALWIARSTGPPEPTGSWRSRVLAGLLALQVVAGVFASAVDLALPFSNGRAVAERIASLGVEGLPLLGHREPPAASVSLYLGRPLYSPSRNVFAFYPDWGPSQRELGAPEVRCAARRLARTTGRDVVLVMSWEPPPWPETDALGACLGAIQATEDFRLYRLRVDRLERTAPGAACPGEDGYFPATPRNPRVK